MKKTILLVLLLLSSPIFGWASNCDGSGNCYIYAGATGSGDGSSWTNACTGFTGTCAPPDMTRGVTYWVAAGNYGGATFSTAASGTSMITIEAPTTTNHGPATDWSDSFAGQAVIGGSTVSTNYWTFNGQTRGSDWRSSYNLKFWNQTSGSGSAISLGASDVTIEYAEIEGTADDYSGSNSDDAVTLTSGGSNYIGYCWIHDAGSDLVYFLFTGGGSFTFEYNMLERNHTGNDSTHSQAISLSDNPGPIIIRYNYFRDITNTGVIDNDASGGATFTPSWYIYGNTDYWTTSVHLSGTSGQSTDCMLGLFGEVMNGGVVQVYNNNCAAINASQCESGSVGCSSVALYLTGKPSGSSCTNDAEDCCGTTCPTVTVYNNLFWNNYASQDITISNPGGQFTATSGYGQFYCPSTGCSNGGGYGLNANSATNDVGSNTGNPFVDFDSSTNFNFELVADTSAGLSISGWSTSPSGCASGVNCENVDPLGVTRGADGTIDRGAFQIGGGATPSPPTNVTATPH